MIYFIMEKEKPVQCDVKKWFKWIKKAKRIIRKDIIEKDNGKTIEVKTLFSGFHICHAIDCIPKLWNVLIWHGDNFHIKHYQSKEEAEIAHQNICAAFKRSTFKIIEGLGND